MTDVNVAELRRALEEAEAEICRLVEDDPVNGYGGWRRREFEGRSSGDYSKWPAIAKALKEGAPDPAEEWTPVPEQVDLTKMPGYQMGYQAGFGERSKVPAAWTRIIESVLARVLAGEPAAQVVADYADEHGHTIQGLEWVARLVKAAREQRKREDLMLGILPMSAHGRTECAAVSDWINAGAALDDALLEESKDA